MGRLLQLKEKKSFSFTKRKIIRNWILFENIFKTKLHGPSGNCGMKASAQKKKEIAEAPSVEIPWKQTPCGRLAEKGRNADAKTEKFGSQTKSKFWGVPTVSCPFIEHRHYCSRMKRINKLSEPSLGDGQRRPFRRFTTVAKGHVNGIKRTHSSGRNRLDLSRNSNEILWKTLQWN